MRRKLPLLLGATFLALAMVGCEGETGPAGPAGPTGAAGPAGPAGPAGQDALNTCSDCHSSDATIVAIEQQFTLSPHGFGNYEVRGPDYAGGSCVGCHTSQGFVAAATGGTADWTGGAASMNCRTCHQIHTTYEGDDFALTTTAPVTLALTGNTVDFSYGVAEIEGANLCATCHQGRIRSPWPTQITDMNATFDITSSHFGPHYGVQGNIFAAELGFAFGNTTEGEFFRGHESNDVGCTTCHMATEGFTPTPGGEGFHNYQPSPVTCNTCHTGPDLDTGFDYRGTPSTVYADILGIGTCLETIGIIGIANVPPAPSPDLAWLHGGAVIDFHPNVGTYPEPLVAAYVVWAAMADDGSWGVHNAEYVRNQTAGLISFLQANYAATCPNL